MSDTTALRQVLIDNLNIFLVLAIFLVPLFVGVAAFVAAMDRDSRKSDARWQQAMAEAQEWREDCLAKGGYVRQDKWVVEVPFRKAAQRYEARYRSVCVLAPAAA